MNKEICPDCQGTGWVLKNAKGSTLAKRCGCYDLEKTQILFDQTNIPKRYENCSFQNFEIHDPTHRHALKISQKFVKDFPAQEIGLLFQGPCGVGKTHLAVAIIHELIQKKSVPCYFCDFRELIRNIQKTYTPESALTETDVLDPIFKTEVVVLDELGAKRTSAWVEETVFYIINHRYNNNKLTVFTSNYIDSGEEEDTREAFYKKEEDSLVDRIGVRLRSRIYEMCRIINVGGDDYRRKLKQGSYRS